MAENIDAERERAAFEAEVRKLDLPADALDRWPDGRYLQEPIECYWSGWQMARRASASIGEDGLPELDQHRIVELWDSTESGGMVGRYVRFARAVACDAVAADRQSRISADQWAALEAARLRLEAGKLAREARKDQAEPAAAQFKMPGETWEECGIDEEDAMRARGYKFRYLYAAPPLSSEQQAEKGEK